MNIGKQRIVVFFSTAISIMLFAPAARAAADPIAMDHFKEGDVLRYSVPFLQGSLADETVDSITVTNLSSSRDMREQTGMAYHGRFKVFADLVAGDNDLLIKAGGASEHFHLTYQPQTNHYFIRAVLFTDNTGDTKYETPLPNDSQDYHGKFDTLLKIMQSYTADWMDHYGYGRRTFNLELDSNGKVIVHVLKGSAPADHYRYDMDRNGLYDSITDEVIKSIPESQCVDCTLISFSNMDRKLGHSVAYTALGGGRVALFGGACMYSFPNSLAQVQKTFTDGTYVDGRMYVSDSIDRFTIWATASTSLGAMLHEMGHSMGLPHSDDPRDIMTRGIDNFGRYFVFYDPPSRRNPKTVYFTPDQVGYWSPVSAASLAPTVWLELDAKTHVKPQAETTVELSTDSSTFTISNPRGVGFVGFERPGAAHSFEKIDYTQPLPTTLHLSADKVFSAVGKDASQFRVIDGNGDASEFNLNEYGWAFIRRWHVIRGATPWPDAATLPQLTDAQTASLVSDAMQQPLGTSPSGMIRFQGDAAGLNYAAISIKSNTDQAITLHTGGDGTLRVWVNGVLVGQEADRKAKPDAEHFPANLKAGDNTILVEVGHSKGAGTFQLRLTSADDNGIRVKDDGTLVELKTPELLH